uniref:(northern house mosquito) hypothetical protein n=1 Tax=Culex pipiens TaxID=7175 RepID=A0A8D8JS62_CULPI
MLKAQPFGESFASLVGIGNNRQKEEKKQNKLKITTIEKLCFPAKNSRQHPIFPPKLFVASRWLSLPTISYRDRALTCFSLPLQFHVRSLFKMVCTLDCSLKNLPAYILSCFALLSHTHTQHQLDIT